MIKVLFLINKFTIGGAETVVLNEINLLDKSRFDPYLGVLYSSTKKETLFSKLKIPREKVAVFNLSDLLDPAGYWRLYKFIRKEKFDAIFCNLFESNFVGRIVAKIAGVKVIIAAEHSAYFNKSSWQKTADKILSYISSTIVAVSKEVADFTSKQEQIKREKFTVINQISNFKPAGLFDRDNLRTQHKILKRALVSITVGRFSPEKAQERVIDIAEDIIFRRQRTDIFFLIIGYGPREEELRNIVKEKKLSKWVKIITDPENAKEYAVCGDVFLLPSKREGVPVALLEAMVSGLVPIASNVGGVKSVIGEAGFVGSSGDLVFMADKLCFLADHREELKRLSLIAQTTVDRSIGKIEDLEKLIESRLK